MCLQCHIVLYLCPGRGDRIGHPRRIERLYFDQSRSRPGSIQSVRFNNARARQGSLGVRRPPKYRPNALEMLSMVVVLASSKLRN